MLSASPPARGLPASAQPLLSTSGQFVIRSSGGGVPREGASDPATDPNHLRLEPAFVAVSCERIRQSLLHDLSATDPWQGRIYVELYGGRSKAQAITVTSERFRNGWQYQVQVPTIVERELFIRAMVQVLLLEMANRSSSGRLAEIPVWLTDGFTQRLLCSKESELILPPPRESVNGITATATRITARLDDPVAVARQHLHGQAPLTFDQLSWRRDDEMSGPDAELYRASAQLFLGELLCLRDGRSCITSFVGRLPRYFNWQLAFLQAFHSHFERALDIEKWWALCSIQSPDRELVQKQPGQGTWHDLEQALLVSAAGAPQGSEGHGAAGSTLQVVIRNWGRVQQRQALSGKVQELVLLRSRLPADLALLAQEYCDALDVYLRNPHWSGSVRFLGTGTGLSSAATETVERLDALDARRQALRPSQAPVTAAHTESAPFPD